MIKKFVALLFVFVLLSGLVGIIPLQEAQAVEPDFIDKGISEQRAKVSPTYARGDNWEVTALDFNVFEKRAGLPLWLWSENENKYVSYIFTDNYEYGGYYEVSNSRIGVRIYDYYAEFYNPEMTEIRLHNEQWDIERWVPQGQGRWDSLGQGVLNNFVISQDGSTINITKSFTSWAGLLEIVYTFREGQPLKHTIIFTSVLSETTFRVIQEWNGIVSDKVIKNKGANNKDTIFTFTDNSGRFMIGEDQTEAVEWLEPVTFEAHPNGKKGNYIFSNWTLTQYESLMIDPATYTTWAVQDATPAESGGGPQADACRAGFLFIGRIDPGWDYWGYIRFNITRGLPAASVITGVELQTWVDHSDPGTHDIGLHQQLNDTWTRSGAGCLTWNNRPTNGTLIQTDGIAKPGPDYWYNWTSANLDTYVNSSYLASDDLISFTLLGNNTVNDDRIAISSITTGAGSYLVITYSIPSGLTAAFYANDLATNATALTDIYITMTNVTATYQFDISGLYEILGNQAAGSMNFSAQAYNTTNVNSWVLINGTGTFEYTFAGDASIRFYLSLYQNIEWVFNSNNGTAFNMAFFQVTFGNNGTQANVVTNSVWVNGSNTINDMNWQGDNVKNATHTFTITDDNMDLVFEPRIYTLRLTAVHAIGLGTIPSAITYNATLANSTVVNSLSTTGGIVGIYLQNSTIAANFTVWWHGIIVNSTTITYVMSGDNTSDVIVQVGRDLSDKTLFAEGVSAGGIESLMVEGIEDSYKIEPTSIIMNGTTYTQATWIGGVSRWNYTIALNLFNLSDTSLKPNTVIHTISIDIVNRQVQFNATGSETLWIIAYEGVACDGTVRTINIVDEVAADAFPTPALYNVNITAFYDDYFLAVGSNIQNFTICNEPFIVASVNQTSTGRTYFRTLIPSLTPQNMYIPDVTLDSIALYTLQIIDLTGQYEGATVRITVSGIEVASGYLDSSYRFEVYLIDGFFFDMVITANGNSFSVGGLNANPGDVNIAITVKEISMSAGRSPRSDIIVWGAEWVGPNVAVAYNDTQVLTTALNIKIYEQNFETKGYSLVFDTDYGASSDVTALYAGNSSLGYYAKLTYTQTTFGTVQEQRPVVRASMGFPMPNFPADILGLDQIFPGEPNAWVYLISMFIVIGTSLVFGAVMGTTGAIIVGVIGLFFIAAGWLPGSITYGIGGLSIALLASFAKSRSR